MWLHNIVPFTEPSDLYDEAAILIKLPNCWKAL